jgi:hypothetical protein
VQTQHTGNLVQNAALFFRNFANSSYDTLEDVDRAGGWMEAVTFLCVCVFFFNSGGDHFEFSSERQSHVSRDFVTPGVFR